MEAMKEMTLAPEMLEAAAGGDNIVTDICDGIRSALITRMRNAKKSGQSFEQFMISLFEKKLPDDLMSSYRQFWDTL